MQVPDQPQFTVDQHVGVAAWVNPKTVSGDQPIVIKRLNNKTAFSLGIHNGNIEMSVVLSTGKTIISRAPIAANKWTHVAGMYDGTFVFLFINGQQFGQVFGAGTVRDVFAPIRIGATTQSQFFNGTIDEVFLTTQTITSDVLTSLSCIGRPSTLSVNPADERPGPAGHHRSLRRVGARTTTSVLARPSNTRLFLQPGRAGLQHQRRIELLSPYCQAQAQVRRFGDRHGQTQTPGLHTLPFIVDAFSANEVRFRTAERTAQLRARGTDGLLRAHCAVS